MVRKQEFDELQERYNMVKMELLEIERETNDFIKSAEVFKKMIAVWHNDLLSAFHRGNLKNAVATVISEMSKFAIHYEKPLHPKLKNL